MTRHKGKSRLLWEIYTVSRPAFGLILALVFGAIGFLFGALFGFKWELAFAFFALPFVFVWLAYAVMKTQRRNSTQ